MSETLFRIWVVDDDPVARMVAIEELDAPHFVTCEFASGEAALAARDPLGEPPDLVLLDVDMPGGADGFAVCRTLREQGDDALQILFVSARDDIESRLAGYEAGGDDFIVKPYSRDELLQKVRVAERAAAARRSLEAQISQARQVAFTAMSSMGEMGTVFDFIRASLASDQPEALAGCVIEAMRQYGLRASVRLTAGGVVLHRADHGTCSALEESILAHAAGMERIFQMGSRMVINYPRITLLTANLPLADADRVGRLRDHLAIVCELAGARLAVIEGEQARAQQIAGMADAAGVLGQALNDIEARRRRTRAAALRASQAYLERLVNAFVGMGLTETQEETLMAMAQDATAEIGTLLEDDPGLAARLREVAASLERLAGQAGAQPAAGAG